MWRRTVHASVRRLTFGEWAAVGGILVLTGAIGIAIWTHASIRWPLNDGGWLVAGLGVAAAVLLGYARLSVHHSQRADQHRSDAPAWTWNSKPTSAANSRVANEIGFRVTVVQSVERATDPPRERGSTPTSTRPSRLFISPEAGRASRPPARSPAIETRADDDGVLAADADIPPPAAIESQSAPNGRLSKDAPSDGALLPKRERRRAGRGNGPAEPAEESDRAPRPARRRNDLPVSPATAAGSPRPGITDDLENLAARLMRGVGTPSPDDGAASDQVLRTGPGRPRSRTGRGSPPPNPFSWPEANRRSDPD